MKENKFKELLKMYLTFFKVGAFTFGGGYSMVSLIQTEVAEKKKWLSDEEMLDIIAISESTPGSLSVNVATFVGYRRYKVLGGIIATLGVETPSLLIITLIALFYDQFIKISAISSIFAMIVVAVIVLISTAVVKFYKPVRKQGNQILNHILIVGAFIAYFFFDVSSILLIIAGGLIGFIFYSLTSRRKEEK